MLFSVEESIPELLPFVHSVYCSFLLWVMRWCFPLRVYNKVTLLAHLCSALPSVSYATS